MKKPVKHILTHFLMMKQNIKRSYVIMMKPNFSLLAGLILLSVIGGSTISHADTQAYPTQNHTDFFVMTGQEFPDQVFYSCDEIQAGATQLLQILGATQVNIDCQGGIDPYGSYSSPHLSLNFESVQTGMPAGTESAVSANFKTVRLQGVQGCDLEKQIFEQVKGAFDILKQSGDFSCMIPDASYSVTLTILAAE